ncbi:MAG: hypothetical protein QXU09_02110 [Thermoproteota archaeon]
MNRVIRVILNSTAFVLICIVGVLLLESSPNLGLLILLSSIDQLEDVYTYIYNRRLFPKSFFIIDIFFEILSIIVGAWMMLLGIMYYPFFHTLFFLLMIVLGALIIESAIEDILSYTGFYNRGVEHEVREEERKFVIKKA